MEIIPVIFGATGTKTVRITLGLVEILLLWLVKMCVNVNVNVNVCVSVANRYEVTSYKLKTFTI